MKPPVSTHQAEPKQKTLEMRHPSNGGFSLVEVVMALGIASFCLVNLLALTGIGLMGMTKAIDANNEAQILQAITSEIQGADFKYIIGQESKSFASTFPRGYDNEGQALVDAASSGPAYSNPPYVATVIVREHGIDSTGYADNGKSARVVTVVIANRATRGPDTVNGWANRREADYGGNPPGKVYGVLSLNNGR